MIIHFNDAEKKEKVMRKAGALVKNYVLEDVVMGRVDENRIPIKRYLQELRLKCDENTLQQALLLCGVATSGNKILFERDRERCRRDFFTKQMRQIFIESPILRYAIFERDNIPKRMADEDEFFAKLYEIYVKALDVTDYEEYKAVALHEDNVIKEQKLVAAVKLLSLKKGACVGRWSLRVSSPTYFIERMIKYERLEMRLQNDDTESAEYLFAVLSSFLFLDGKNYAQYQQKLLRCYDLYYKKEEPENEDFIMD